MYLQRQMVGWLIDLRNITDLLFLNRIFFEPDRTAEGIDIEKFIIINDTDPQIIDRIFRSQLTSVITASIQQHFIIAFKTAIPEDQILILQIRICTDDICLFAARNDQIAVFIELIVIDPFLILINEEFDHIITVLHNDFVSFCFRFPDLRMIAEIIVFFQSDIETIMAVIDRDAFIRGILLGVQKITVELQTVFDDDEHHPVLTRILT